MELVVAAELDPPGRGPGDEGLERDARRLERFEQADRMDVTGHEPPVVEPLHKAMVRQPLDVRGRSCPRATPALRRSAASLGGSVRYPHAQSACSRGQGPCRLPGVDPIRTVAGYPRMRPARRHGIVVPLRSGP